MCALCGCGYVCGYVRGLHVLAQSIQLQVMYRHTGTKMEELLTLQAALKDEVAEAQGKVVTEEALRPPHLGTKKTACETCHFAKGTASEEERDAVRNHKRVYHKCGGACPGDHVNHKCQISGQHDRSQACADRAG